MNPPNDHPSYVTILRTQYNGYCERILDLGQTVQVLERRGQYLVVEGNHWVHESHCEPAMTPPPESFDPFPGAFP